MDGHPERSSAQFPTHVRVLHGDEELADAVARAEEGAKRLNDRLAARAARDAWMAEHTEQRLGWLHFVRDAAESSPIVAVAAPARPNQRTAASGRVVSTSPAARRHLAAS